MKKQKPFLIGIAGGSGSGKTTAVRNITKELQSTEYCCISHDSYYKDLSGLPMDERKTANFDHPSSLETNLLVSHLMELIQGKRIKSPHYDFQTHTRTKETTLLNPSKIVIVEGILIFDSPKLRDLFDLKIFIDTPDDIRFIRRLERDVAQRGRIVGEVIRQYMETVRPMYLEFVEPTKRYADLIVPEGGENWVALKVVHARVQCALQENCHEGF